MATAKAGKANTRSGEVAVKMFDTLVKEYGRENVTQLDAHVAKVRVPWSYTPPGGEPVRGEVEVVLPLSLDGLLGLVSDGTYTEAQVLSFTRRGAVLAATQAARQAAQRGTTAQESLARQLARLAERAKALGIDLDTLLDRA